MTFDVLAIAEKRSMGAGPVGRRTIYRISRRVAMSSTGDGCRHTAIGSELSPATITWGPFWLVSVDLDRDDPRNRKRCSTNIPPKSAGSCCHENGDNARDASPGGRKDAKSRSGPTPSCVLKGRPVFGRDALCIG
jgi:hypothetical protein